MQFKIIIKNKNFVHFIWTLKLSENIYECISNYSNISVNINNCKSLQYFNYQRQSIVKHMDLNLVSICNFSILTYQIFKNYNIGGVLERLRQIFATFSKCIFTLSILINDHFLFSMLQLNLVLTHVISQNCYLNLVGFIVVRNTILGTMVPLRIQSFLTLTYFLILPYASIELHFSQTFRKCRMNKIFATRKRRWQIKS